MYKIGVTEAGMYLHQDWLVLVKGLLILTFYSQIHLKKKKKTERSASI